MNKMEYGDKDININLKF